jgi:hypothetical protein
MGKYFDDLVTRVAAGKAEQLSDKLNAEVVRRVASFKEYGVFSGIDYAPGQVVLHFEMTRYRSEGIAGHVYPIPDPGAEPVPGTIPLYRALQPRSRAYFYTTNRVEAEQLGYRVAGVACYVYDHAVPDAVPFYRWRTQRDGFYTIAGDGERCARLGYRPQGIACYLHRDPRPGTVPFYRFVDPRTGRHFYTVHPQAEYARS